MIAEDTPIVVSADFRLSKMQDSHLKLEILAGSVGQVPIPVHWILSNLPKDAIPKDNKVEFRLAESTPHLLIEMVESKSDPSLKRIQTFDQKIKMDFGLPMIAH